MTKLIEATQKHFGGETVNCGLVFKFGEDEYFLTNDNSIYSYWDRRLRGLGQKVRSLAAVENFVAERAE